jgi:hypothetical protein
MESCPKRYPIVIAFKLRFEEILAKGKQVQLFFRETAADRQLAKIFDSFHFSEPFDRYESEKSFWAS